MGEGMIALTPISADLAEELCRLSQLDWLAEAGPSNLHIGLLVSFYNRVYW